MPERTEGEPLITRRQVWKMDKAGSLDRLRLAQEDIPPLEPGQIRVRVAAVGLNFADVFAILGLYSATPEGEFIPGLEFAGVVEEIGRPSEGGSGRRGRGRNRGRRGGGGEGRDGEGRGGDRNESRRGPTKFQVGDRVMGVTRFGAYTSHVNIDARYLQPLPPKWDFAEGAAYLAQGLTAFYALKPLGDISQGDAVLIHSAAGGVGLLAIEMVKKFRGRIVATVGDESKVDFLMRRCRLNRDQIIVRDPRSFGAELDRALKSIDREGFDILLDSVSGDYFFPAYERLKPAGRHVIFGSAGFMPRGNRPNYLRLGLQYLRRPRLDPLNMMSENKNLMAFNLIWLWEQVDKFQDMFRQMRSLNLPAPHVGHRFDFEEARAALQLFKSGKTVGKVVLEF